MVRWMGAAFALLWFSSAFARADVSLRNGNFFVSLRDISYPGGIEPKVERVYNSKADFTGMFGYSWGTEYEAKLSVDPDGSVIITEFGGGANIRFTPKNYSTKELGQAVTDLTNAARKAGVVTTAKDLEKYKKRLQDDYEYRAKQYAVYVGKGLVPRKLLKEGSQFVSTQFQYQYLTKVKGGYVRVLEGGAVQKYNEAGRLVQLLDSNKNYITFSYNKNGRIVQISDNQNRKLNFTYNAFNLVERISGESGKHADYKYSKDGFLIWSRDDQGVENTFSYTTDQFKNLTELGFPGDKDLKGNAKKMTILYYGPDKNSSVKKVINPDGTTNEYEYSTDPKKPNYYSVRVLLKEANGARISDSKYEYFYKIRPGGDEFTSKMIETVDGEKKETVYDERLGFPIKVTARGKTTTMQYDVKGRMIKKTTPVETTELKYDPKVGKVTHVVRKVKSGTVLWSQFQYDPKSGNLVFAKNHEKKSVKLVYDAQGRIRALVDEAGRQLTFKYNELSKPIEIADAKRGTVKFTYKNSGEVDKIDSNGGANVATEIMRALQGLIDITAPAGVTMSI